MKLVFFRAEPPISSFFLNIFIHFAFPPQYFHSFNVFFNVNSTLRDDSPTKGQWFIFISVDSVIKGYFCSIFYPIYITRDINPITTFILVYFGLFSGFLFFFNFILYQLISVYRGTSAISVI